jgi:hypothetical protein
LLPDDGLFGKYKSGNPNFRVADDPEVIQMDSKLPLRNGG